MSHLWETSWSNTTAGMSGDWLLATVDEEDNVGGFHEGNLLGTAIVLALFTDARVPDWMIGSFGYTVDDQIEWHGNNLEFDEGEEQLGSYLHTLRRHPINEETARLAEHYAALALQPLIRQKIVSAFDITSEINKLTGKITLLVRAVGTNDREFFSDLFPLR